jgi:hypothetical protein
MAAHHPKRPRDPNQLAKLIADLATGAADEARADTNDSGKDPAARRRKASDHWQS